jgi:gamma-glutamyltranspeptidase/glutathione hydrolase
MTSAHSAACHLPSGFYTGPVAEAIVVALASRGGVMAAQDLADHKTVALDPISTEYR